MGDSNIQSVQQPNISGTTAAEAQLSQAKTDREKIAALADQFKVSPRVARALYRGIIKKNPQVSGATLLAQFAQAVSKRTLAKAGSDQAGQTSLASAQKSTSPGSDAAKDTLTIGGGPAASLFIAAAPAANSSGLNQQEFKQVTQNAQAGPVLPPPKFPVQGVPVPDLGQTLEKMVFLNPNHPNWQAFEVLLMDQMNDHAIDRMIESQFTEAVAQYVQMLSADTAAKLTEADVWKERRESQYNMVASALQAHQGYRDELSKKLVNANPVDDPNNLDFKSAISKQQQIGPFTDRLRGDTLSLMSGMREPGSEGEFMDADLAHAKANNLLPGTRTKPKDLKRLMDPYRARTDEQSVKAREERRAYVVDTLQANRPINENLDDFILGQALPGVAGAGEGGNSRIDRRFLTKAEVAKLTPAEQKQHDHVMENFYAARITDLTDCVKDMQDEIGRLRTGAQLARDEAGNPARFPNGTNIEVYKSNCTKMADALEKKADDIQKEHLDPVNMAKQYIQNEVFQNRFSLRTTMQHAEWLRNLASQLKQEIDKDKLRVTFERFPDPRDEFNATHRRKVCEETYHAILRRMDDLQQSVKPFRGDAHQSSNKPLKRNERLDKFDSAPGAALYNKKWDAYEELQAKDHLEPAEHTKMLKLRTFLSEMHGAAPANVWQPWKLERLHDKLEKLNNDPNATPQQKAEANRRLRDAMDDATDNKDSTSRVDKPWLAYLMNRHIKARNKTMSDDLHGKILEEEDPVKKAALIKEFDELKPRLAAREQFWSQQFGNSKANNIKQKAKSVLTSVGLGPGITYNLRSTPVAKAQPHKNHASEAVEQQKADYKNPIVCDHNDAWLDDSKFKNVDPGVDYNDPKALDERLKDAIEARGAALSHWRDPGATDQGAIIDAILDARGHLKDAMDRNNGVAENLAQETADLAGGLVQEMKGDADSVAAQVQGMISRLLPMIGKISPWG